VSEDDRCFEGREYFTTEEVEAALKAEFYADFQLMFNRLARPPKRSLRATLAAFFSKP
jgi:hypothetical protein